jgi:hypothetical protein
VSNVDQRHKRREKSRQAIEKAPERLEQGSATHPRHVGISVRLTRQAVAREARISSATLYRFPDLLALIAETIGARHEQRLRPSEQRRARIVSQVEELERRVAALLAENLRLTRALATHDPTLGENAPVLRDYAQLVAEAPAEG